MRVVMGIAPASDSIHIGGNADAWCDSAASGEKVRCLCGNRKYRFANAGDCFPGSRPGDRGDRTPSPTEGYERLRSVIAEEFNGDPVDVLLLGSTYWKRVLRLEKARSHLRKDMELLPVAVAVPFSTDGLAVASLYLFPIRATGLIPRDATARPTSCFSRRIWPVSPTSGGADLRTCCARPTTYAF